MFHASDPRDARPLAVLELTWDGGPEPDAGLGPSLAPAEFSDLTADAADPAEPPLSGRWY